MQIPRCNHPEVPKEEAVRTAEEARGRSDKGAMPTARNRGVGRAPTSGPHPHGLSIPPKQSVAFAIGFIKGKSAVRIHRELLGNKRVTALHFWSRGYCVSTVGLNEEVIKKYIREQEVLEKRQGEFEFDN